MKTNNFTILIIFIIVGFLFISGLVSTQNTHETINRFGGNNDIVPIKYPYYFCMDTESSLNLKEAGTVELINCPKNEMDERCDSYVAVDYCVNENFLKEFYCIDEKTRGDKTVSCKINNLNSVCSEGICV